MLKMLRISKNDFYKVANCIAKAAYQAKVFLKGKLLGVLKCVFKQTLKFSVSYRGGMGIELAKP